MGEATIDCLVQGAKGETLGGERRTLNNPPMVPRMTMAKRERTTLFRSNSILASLRPFSDVLSFLKGGVLEEECTAVRWHSHLRPSSLAAHDDTLGSKAEHRKLGGEGGEGRTSSMR